MASELVIKWSGQEYTIPLSPEDTVESVKRKIEEKTKVSVKRQKLLGLKAKGKLADDETPMADVKLKPGQKVMMMGTPDAIIESTEKQAELHVEVANDFDLEPEEEKVLDIADDPEYQAKLRRRVESVTVKVINPPREGKKLLVLDVDYTIFDLGSSAERPEELARPYLHEFMTACYEHFDLIIWSASSMKWVEVKMRELGVLNHPDYKLVCMMDRAAMVTVHTERYGVFDCKPLAFIWEKFPDSYNKNNTVMLDDLRRNFIMNKQNGLVIRPYQKSHRNRHVDRELLGLKAYFALIGTRDRLDDLNHHMWESYLTRNGPPSSF